MLQGLAEAISILSLAAPPIFPAWLLANQHFTKPIRVTHLYNEQEDYSMANQGLERILIVLKIIKPGHHSISGQAISIYEQADIHFGQGSISEILAASLGDDLQIFTVIERGFEAVIRHQCHWVNALNGKKRPERGLLEEELEDRDLRKDSYNTCDIEVREQTVAKLNGGGEWEGIYGPLPRGTAGLILGRSSVALRGLVITPGIVDADYEGEIKVLTSAQNGVIIIPEGEHLAQMILIPIIPTSNPPLKGHRGTKGFGSTRSPEGFWVTDMQERLKLTLNIDGKQFCGILDTDADMFILSMEHWPKGWQLEQTGARLQDAERPMWLPERCVCPVDVPADTKDHEDDLDSTNIGTGAMDV
ncbi:hypothetical protein STEG23_027911, partial [Scotinomys teguina]